MEVGGGRWQDGTEGMGRKRSGGEGAGEWDVGPASRQVPGQGPRTVNNVIV